MSIFRGKPKEKFFTEFLQHVRDMGYDVTIDDREPEQTAFARVYKKYGKESIIGFEAGMGHFEKGLISMFTPLIFENDDRMEDFIENISNHQNMILEDIIDPDAPFSVGLLHVDDSVLLCAEMPYDKEGIDRESVEICIGTLVDAYVRLVSKLKDSLQPKVVISEGRIDRKSVV